MSNRFALLDDSGDEGDSPAKVVKMEATKPKKPLEPSKVDSKRHPAQNDRNTKFGRGGRAPTRDGKRAYDRRSGTGRGNETKKGGGGRGNWGSDKNEARQNQGHVEEVADATDPKDPVGDDTDHNEDNFRAEEEPEPAPVDNTVNYEDYMANKANPDNKAFAPVKARAVEDEFAGMKIAKVEIDEEFMMMGGGKQKKTKQKKQNTKTTLTPGFRVARSGDGERQEGGRGDGRGRGRGGRGGGRDGGGRGRDGGGRGRGGDGRGRGGDGRGRGGRSGGRGGRDGGRGARGRDGGRGRTGGRGGGLNVNDQSAFPSL